LTLDRGLIKLNPLTADVYGGKETGSMILDLRPAQPVCTVNLKTDKVDANKLVSSVSSLKQTLYGLLAANVNASFSSTSADSIARSLNGKMDMNLTNGKLMHVDLMQQLAAVGKFLGGTQTASQGFTNLLQLSGNFDVKNGVAQTNNLKAVIDGGTLSGTGLVNLADQTLNMHVTAVLNKAFSQQVGGTQVGGYMTTALANSQGELVLPVIVTGNLQHPQFAPDVQQIAQMRLQNLLPTSKNPGELTTGLLQTILGGKGQTTGQQGQPKGGLQGVLDVLGGKKPTPSPTPDKTAEKKQDQQPQKQNPLGDILEQFRKKKTQPTPTPTASPR
jgi:AsmA protein